MANPIRVFARGQDTKLPACVRRLLDSGHWSPTSRPLISAACGSGAETLPANYLHLGAIAALFPNASIIHCRRNPMDTCVSCFFQSFIEPGAIGFSNDLGDLGFLYRIYEKLMDHWRSVLPIPILDVDYEDVVGDQETMSRRILEFVGLDWHEDCLNFDKTDRGISTASAWQVRQPIYTSSIEKWHRCEKHLGPL